jgi:hypothetical protein
LREKKEIKGWMAINYLSRFEMRLCTTNSFFHMLKIYPVSSAKDFSYIFKSAIYRTIYPLITTAYD